MSLGWAVPGSAWHFFGLGSAGPGSAGHVYGASESHTVNGRFVGAHYVLVGASLRVSCSLRVLSSLLGVAGVGSSSALAGHLTRHVGKQLKAGKSPLKILLQPTWMKGIEVDELVVDALLGILAFRAGKPPLKILLQPSWMEGIEVDELVVDALLGILAFRHETRKAGRASDGSKGGGGGGGGNGL
eukprot:gene30529-35558_t